MKLKLRVAANSLKEMGLGKTLSLLALVCASVDMQAEQITSSRNDMYHATLIIAPKSGNLYINPV
jgi:hypothetical protein